MRIYTLPEINYFWDTKWKEAREESFTANVGNTTASATLVGYIDAKDFALAIAAILGYSICLYSGSPPHQIRRLHRVAPVCHPRLRNLYASSVRVTPYSFTKPDEAFQHKEIAPTYKGIFVERPDFKESFNVIKYTSAYKVLKVEIDFSEFVGVVFASNEQPGFEKDFKNYEHRRFAQVTFDYNLEILQMDNAASLVFDAGPPKEQSFPTPVGIMLPQAKLIIKWLWVPHEFLSDYYLVNYKIVYNNTIQSKLGHVNEDEFLGFKPGTLLFTSWKTEPIVVPVADKDLGWVHMRLAWNVNFEFLYLNTISNASYEGMPEWAKRGHNVFPWRGDGLFYPATIRKEKSPVPGRPLYPPTNFGEMFLTDRRAPALGI